MSAHQPSSPYPGARLGFPQSGPGSVASWTRRLAALVIDWIASTLVIIAVIGADRWSETNASGWTLLVFWLQASIFTATMGGSFGQVVLRIRVMRLDGRRLDIARALLRSLLICVVIPPLVFNADQRGLHDLAADAVPVNLR
ncbi:putative RDD family membrane protein YckC [Nocardioides massiliensis]|uniref:RDD family membrane protein YckC n=2 Tax=Nocardioides massiliensis TaxID=1325935 RepID=A0ABT9NT78_9ACTN|nr:RDD family protein [Nocardioides massiliensis]MDP9823618.1 putative RDD family membrane protein YckC [Nocardioides massiliensis]